MNRFTRAILVALTIGFSFLLPTGAAVAADMPVVVCTGLPGCGEGPSDVLFEHALMTVVKVLVNAAAGLAVLFIVISGVMMVLAFGDDSKITKARWGIIYSLGGLGLALVSASIVQVVSTELLVSEDGDILTEFMASIIRIILVLFNVAFTIVIIAAGLRMVIAQGKGDEFQKAWHMIKWAVVGAIIVNLSRALVSGFLSLNL